ncbi:MAG: imelysin family protein, partial [Chitinophagales bacterium]
MPAFKVPYYQVLIPVLLLLQACSGNKPDKEKSEAEKQIVVHGYSEIVYFTYESAYNSALTLGQAVDSFLENPSQLTLDRAREAWRAARVPYNYAEAYRFYDGPIDNGAQGVEGLLNAWPLDEVYVDYVDGAPDAGIINNRKDYPEITKDLLISLNEHGGEENISTGYHAIEFMLWGQDL